MAANIHPAAATSGAALGVAAAATTVIVAAADHWGVTITGQTSGAIVLLIAFVLIVLFHGKVPDVPGMPIDPAVAAQPSITVTAKDSAQ